MAWWQGRVPRMETRIDRDTRLLAFLIETHQPLFFARVGDGAIECINGVRRAPHTCDGELYTVGLALHLEAAVDSLKDGAHVIWGNWEFACRGSKPTYVQEWKRLIGLDKSWRSLVDYE